MNLASEASISFLTLKKPIGNNLGYSYILLIEYHVAVYVYENSMVDFLREKVSSSRKVAFFSSLKRFLQVWHSF